MQGNVNHSLPPLTTLLQPTYIRFFQSSSVPPVDFLRRLDEAQTRRDSLLCVGLDPDLGRLPPHLLASRAAPDAVLSFNLEIIKATAEVASAYKLNLAFYEALGADGWRVLAETRAALPDDAIAIADAKRGDIGNSARFYASALFRELSFDAVTVAPYMGRDAVMPFLQFDGRAAFVLARTSNPGAADFQEQLCGDDPLYMRVARSVAQWDRDVPGSAGLVAGATELTALAALREACPTLPFLIPGVGAQGGSAQTALRAAETDQGRVLVNSSRQILYASDRLDFAEAAGREAAALRDQLRPRRTRSRTGGEV